MCRKIGLEPGDHGFKLARDLLKIMHQDRTDFTVTFRTLARNAAEPRPFEALFASGDAIRSWTDRWRNTLRAQGTSETSAGRAMRRANPAYIPRNHRIEEAIRAAEDKNDFEPALRLAEVLANPFEEQPDFAAYAEPPLPGDRVHQTFCGT